MIAFALEQRENWRLLWWLVPQRIGYRQIMYYVLSKSVATAAKGHFVGWGKLDRKATVGAAVAAQRKEGPPGASTPVPSAPHASAREDVRAKSDAA